MTKKWCFYTSALLLVSGWVWQPALAQLVDTEKADTVQPLAILIGIDGLRADTLERIQAPNMQGLAKGGVFASMVPAMPTKTFTNFYSLATGLHPKHHGMISNKPYDRELKLRFNEKQDQSNPFWWQGEPIWITAEKQGVTSATYFWVGSEVEFAGVRPTYWKPYDQNKDYAQRIDEVLDWVRLPKTIRPQLITLYFSSVDSAAHTHGVGSPQEKAAVLDVDKHIGNLLEGLAELGLKQQVNMILVSDHGMVNLSDDKVINLDPHIDWSSFVVPDWSNDKALVFAPFLYLYADKEQVELAYQKLQKVHPSLQVFKGDTLPKHYHFDHPQRQPDLVLLADPGWSIYASRDGRQPPSFALSGEAVATHGYDNHSELMQAIFIASGPAFKQGVKAKPFENINVYSMLACILDIQPAKTDGHLSVISHLLTQKCGS